MPGVFTWVCKQDKSCTLIEFYSSSTLANVYSMLHVTLTRMLPLLGTTISKDVASLRYHRTHGIFFFFCKALKYLPATAIASALYHLPSDAISRPYYCSQLGPIFALDVFSCRVAPSSDEGPEEASCSPIPFPFQVLERQDCRSVSWSSMSYLDLAQRLIQLHTFPTNH